MSRQIQVLVVWNLLEFFFSNIFNVQLVEPVDVEVMDTEGCLYKEKDGRSDCTITKNLLNTINKMTRD